MQALLDDVEQRVKQHSDAVLTAVGAALPLKAAVDSPSHSSLPLHFGAQEKCAQFTVVISSAAQDMNTSSSGKSSLPVLNGGHGDTLPHGVKRDREGNHAGPRPQDIRNAAVPAGLKAGVAANSSSFVRGAGDICSSPTAAGNATADADELEELRRLRRRLLEPAAAAPPVSVSGPVRSQQATGLQPARAAPAMPPPPLPGPAQLAERAERVQVALREVFGLASFRPLQREIVDAALDRQAGPRRRRASAASCRRKRAAALDACHSMIA